MNRPSSTLSHRYLGSLFPAIVLIAAVFILIGAAQLPRPHISSIHDWTQHHLIYSQPSTWVSAWRAQQDPRYWQQKIRRGEMNQLRASDPNESRLEAESRIAAESRRWERPEDDGPNPDWAHNPFRFHGPTGWHPHLREVPMERDWGTSLGAGGSTGVPVAGTTWFPVYPAKFTFNTASTPDCTNDFVVFPTNLSGSTTKASIIAYNKLYSAPTGTTLCSSTAPAVYWSYNTNHNATGGATTGTIATSPILSLDGTKVAFIENDGGSGAILHLLKWKAGDGGAINTAANPTTAASWTACPATGACMISITFANTNTDTGSSPFYDYTHDALYVGDDLAVLHKFVNVFGINGATPSEVTTGGWPFTIDTAVTPNPALSSPVLDGASGNIFVDDLNGTLTYVRETFSTVGTCKTGSPPCIGSTTVVPAQVHSIIDAPIVDSSTQKVFVFYANYDGNNMAVVQSDTALSAKVPTLAGSKLNQRHMHAGAFDNTYLGGTGNTGRLYVCGGSATGQPTLMRVGFNNTAPTFPNATGTMNTTVDATPTLQVVSSLNNVDCGPLTEFFNSNAAAASQDQLFFGVAGDSTSATCIAAGVGCVMSVNITNIPAALTMGSSIPEIMGPSGIIVDNNSTSAQASSLYFSNQGNSTNAIKCGPATGGTVGVGCAVKVTQAGLN
ncbi:MAG TPA: hypothetical protein VGJ06_11125 [Candidatus Acidoferrum sp.]